MSNKIDYTSGRTFKPGYFTEHHEQLGPNKMKLFVRDDLTSLGARDLLYKITDKLHWDSSHRTM